MRLMGRFPPLIALSLAPCSVTAVHDLPTTNCAVIVGLICPDTAEPGLSARRLVDAGADALMVSHATQQPAAIGAVDTSVPVFIDLPAEWAERATTVAATFEKRGSTAATAASVALAQGATVLVAEDVASVRRVRDMFNHLQQHQQEEAP